MHGFVADPVDDIIFYTPGTLAPGTIEISAFASATYSLPCCHYTIVQGGTMVG